MMAVLVAVIAGVVRLTRNHPEIALRHGTHIAMVILAVAFVVGGLFLVRRALAPFRSLRAGLSSVRDGSRASASSRAAPGVRCLVLPSVDGLVRTMLRLHAERELAIDVEVSPAHEIRGRREDLDEMLGNLLDNACKWARSRVAISSSIDDASVVLSVDDGPGLDPSMRAHVLQRGVRADQQVRGSGLGLAIVSDLAELYGGSVVLETSPLGGTRARLQLPRTIEA